MAQALLFYLSPVRLPDVYYPPWRENRRLLLKINTITDNLSSGQGISVAGRALKSLKSPCHGLVLV